MTCGSHRTCYYSTQEYEDKIKDLEEKIQKRREVHNASDY